MTNNSVSFGSTRISYLRNKNTLSHYVNKIMTYPKRSFWDAKGFTTLQEAQTKMAPGQFGVVLEKDAIRFVGNDNIDDKLIYRILTNNGKNKPEGIQFVNDSINIIA